MTRGGPASDLLSGGVRRVNEAVRRLSRRLAVIEKLAGREIVSGPSVRLPWRRRLALWRHGFTSRSGVLFGVDGEWEEFVSDYQLELLDELGGRWAHVADNKLLSHLLLGPFDDHLPDLYGMVDDGRLNRRLPAVSDRLADGTDGADAHEWLDAFLDATDAVVLKPTYGHGGRGVFVCRKEPESGGFRVDTETRSPSEFAAFIEDLDEYLAWEYVEQAEYAASLFPGSTNTLRVLTLWDEDADEPFVAGAVQRVGTAESAPVDNWGRGGLSADIGADGTLGSGAQWSSGDVHRHRTHPDTGARIEGERIPEWPTIRDRVVEMATAFPSLPRIGWDVVVRDEGSFAVLEINTHPGVETFQVHRPHLSDPRVRRFYEYHGYA